MRARVATSSALVNRFNSDLKALKPICIFRELLHKSHLSPRTWFSLMISQSPFILIARLLGQSSSRDTMFEVVVICDESHDFKFSRFFAYLQCYLTYSSPSTSF